MEMEKNPKVVKITIKQNYTLAVNICKSMLLSMTYFTLTTKKILLGIIVLYFSSLLTDRFNIYWLFQHYYNVWCILSKTFNVVLKWQTFICMVSLSILTVLGPFIREYSTATLALWVHTYMSISLATNYRSFRCWLDWLIHNIMCVWMQEHFDGLKQQISYTSLRI